MECQNLFWLDQDPLDPAVAGLEFVAQADAPRVAAEAYLKRLAVADKLARSLSHQRYLRLRRSQAQAQLEVGAFQARPSTLTLDMVANINTAAPMEGVTRSHSAAQGTDSPSPPCDSVFRAPSIEEIVNYLQRSNTIKLRRQTSSPIPKMKC